MNYDLRKPCPHCPFRTDIRPYLHQDRVEEIAEILRGSGSFACHETARSLHPDRRLPEQHCAGALIVLEKEFASNGGACANGHLRLMARFGFFDPDKLDLSAPVFDDFDTMIDAQASD